MDDPDGDNSPSISMSDLANNQSIMGASDLPTGRSGSTNLGATSTSPSIIETQKTSRP